MSDRYKNAQAFVQGQGGDAESVRLIAGDASNRKYYRLLRHNEAVILMDAPPDKGEDVRPFVRIAQYLNKVGLNAPDILAVDETHGFLLLQDLGDDLFARLLSSGSATEHPLYSAATDVLVHLHQQAPPELERYDSTRTPELAALSVDWYRRGLLDDHDQKLSDDVTRHMREVLSPLDPDCSVLIQRDYHAENLLWLPNERGVERVGLLDFQDAMLGHPSYDLVSILQDARRDVLLETEQQMQDQFIAELGLIRADFLHAYAVMGLQRNLRILGVFARLCIRDGKANYIDLIPRVWRHVETNLQTIESSDLTKCLMDALPAPTKAGLSKLKEQCA